MKEYTMKIHLYFNMCNIILDIYKQMDTTKAKKCRFVKLSPIPIKTAQNTKLNTMQ